MIWLCHGDDSVQGLQQTVLYCGDGINDLPALSAADVGYAVGATSVAASLFTTRCSVSGKSSLFAVLSALQHVRARCKDSP